MKPQKFFFHLKNGWSVIEAEVDRKNFFFFQVFSSLASSEISFWKFWNDFVSIGRYFKVLARWNELVIQLSIYSLKQTLKDTGHRGLIEVFFPTSSKRPWLYY